nr:transposase, mutator type [Tanacetum cinerariifolium]
MYPFPVILNILLTQLTDDKPNEDLSLKISRALQLVKQVVDPDERVTVLDGQLVQLLINDTHSKQTDLLLNEKRSNPDRSSGNTSGKSHTINISPNLGSSDFVPFIDFRLSSVRSPRTNSTLPFANVLCKARLSKVALAISSLSLSSLGGGIRVITRNEITGNEITWNESTRNEITGKQMVIHVGNSSTVDDVLKLEMLFETEGVGPVGKFKEVEVDAYNESEEESDTEGDYTMDSDSEDLDYDPKHDDLFDDDEHIVEEVHVNMNNFRFTTDPKHDTSIGGVDVQDDDIDVIDYESFGSDLDDGIDSERRMQLRELRRIGKQKKGLDKYYFYLGQQFASKEIMKGRVKKHSVETRRQLILVKTDNERVRVRCEGTIPPLVPYVATDNNTDKNVFSQTIGGPAIKENINSGKQNILGKDKTMEGKGKKVNTPKKLDKNSCPWTMLVTYTKECIWEVQLSGLMYNKNQIHSLLQELLEGCPWSGQILTVVRVDANNGIYPVAYAIVEAERGVYKEMLWNATKATSKGEFKKKMVQKVIAKIVGPLTPPMTKMFDAIKKMLLSTMFNGMEVHAAYRLETLAHVYTFKVNPCNGRDMWPVVESRTVIIPPMYKPPIGRPLKNRKKSNDEIKGCRGQGGGSSQVDAKKVYGQAAGLTNVSGQAASARKVSSQAIGATNVSSQAAGVRKVSGQAAGLRKVSSQAANARKASSQPSAAQSTAKQRPRQGFQDQ